jgi:hypothetical protein
MRLPRFISIFLLFAIAFLIFIPTANAFCGFFVARTDAKLHNSASRVVISHYGDRSVFLMANNFEGDVRDFARIVPIPVIPKRSQVRIGSSEVVDKIDAFTAPRLAKYEDDPCKSEYESYPFIGILLICSVGLLLIISRLVIKAFRATSISERWTRILEILVIFTLVGILIAIAVPSFLNQGYKSRQVSGIAQAFVEDRFTVGEYDVTILSAKESDSLSAWLRGNGYTVPTEAEPMLQSYIQSGMKFFVVKVNLAEFQKLQKKESGKFLRPIVLDYNSPKFMLPMRLGTLNSKKNQPQDLIVSIISPVGYAEVTNYRNVFVPTDNASYPNSVSGLELPDSIQKNFNEFYNAMFQKEYEREGKNAAFIEYMGGSGFCDPCVAKPLDSETLKEAGVFWDNEVNNASDPWGAKNLITRFHIRYTKDKFPEDLQFRIVPYEEAFLKIPADKFFRNILGFQGRYVIRSAWNTFCFAGAPYGNLEAKAKKNLARLTGWNNL